MASLIFAFTKHNPKYTHFNHPEEDSFDYLIEKDKIIVAVADGITRDPIGIKDFPENPDKETIKKLMESYPKPSPAKKAADTFCKTFLKSKNSEKILEIFKEGNNQIKKINQNLNVDYLENDFAACVASGGIIKNNKLYYGFITDCGVCVYNSKFELIFRTPDEGPSKEIDKEAKRLGKNWNQAEWRAKVRSYYRNNPSNPLCYGALTGESSALKFIKTGETNVEKGNIIIFYSDGMAPLLYSEEIHKISNSKDFKKYLENNLEKMQGSEGTIVALQI